MRRIITVTHCTDDSGDTAWSYMLISLTDKDITKLCDLIEHVNALASADRAVRSIRLDGSADCTPIADVEDTPADDVETGLSWYGELYSAGENYAVVADVDGLDGRLDKALDGEPRMDFASVYCDADSAYWEVAVNNGGYVDTPMILYWQLAVWDGRLALDRPWRSLHHDEQHAFRQANPVPKRYAYPVPMDHLP